ncbi:hypothetical protein ACFX2C_007035 [Malus domestica]
MVAMIMLRTLYRDISKYNEFETQEEAQEETGWKLVHGDVFRAPNNSELLCVYVGTGVQFFGMILVTMIFAVIGFLSPSNRGGLMTAMLLLFVFMGIFAGYASTRLYKMFKGTEWKKIAFRTAVMFPATVSVIFIVLNTLIWGQKSSGAVPFGTMFALVFFMVRNLSLTRICGRLCWIQETSTRGSSEDKQNPKILLESDRYVCEIYNQRFQRDQNLQMHRRRHKVPWKLLKREMAEIEFANAKKIRQQAQAEVEKALLLKEQATKRISSATSRARHLAPHALP